MYLQNPKRIITNDLNLNILNNLSLQKIDYKKYPTINIIKFLPKINSLYETALVTINDYFVFKFLENKINFRKLISLICKYSNHIHFTRLKKIPAQNIKDIYKTREYVRYKLDILGI